MKKIMLYALLILGFSSCKKEHTLHIKAINPVTGMGYSGLSYSIKGTRTGSDGEKIVFTYNGTLNTNGEDFPTIKIKENLTYHIGCKEPANICYTKDINFFWDVKANPSPTFQFEYAACAYLQLKVKNVNCFDANDKIIFDMQPSYITNYNNINPQTKFGCYDNEFIDSQIPCGPWTATWEVTKNGITTFHDTAFFINENQHYYLNIEY